ncbi:MAG TPA: hypothetical protein VM841_13540 [Actinomycetota bacterium]|nr:hypothetical protein [Actinomycetota bacterium]
MRSRVRFILPFLLFAAMGLTVAPSHASAPTFTMADVDPSEEGYDPAYVPKSVMLAPGALVRWRNDDWGSRSIHTATAYYGAAFGSSAISPGGFFSTTYDGGTVLFRCMYHSELDTTISPPTCSGMCGAIHDSRQDLAPPSVSITTRDGFIFTGGVRIDGVASDDRAIKTVAVTFRPVVVAPPLLPAKSVVAICAGCDGPAVKWKVFQDAEIKGQAPFLNLPPGQYRVEALATDPHGNSASAQPITIYVLR